MTRTANDNSNQSGPRQPDDNTIQPFQLEVSGLRGRVLRLGAVLDNILATHNYPLPVSVLLAETVVTAVLLASMLKYEGIFTLQTSGEGPVKTLVADITTSGALRAYAGFSEDGVKQLMEAATQKGTGLYDGFTLPQLVGKGYLAFTVDQGEFTERYQGIVALSGDTLAQTVQHYFDQSEQIGTSLKVSVSAGKVGGWRAGGVMLQRMPDPSAKAAEGDTLVPIRPDLTAENEENWTRATVLLQSVTDAELVDASLHSHDLLLRLFHEEGVRIFQPLPVINQCRCSTERVSKVLATLTPDDREHAATNGIIEMTCEFCSRKYRFHADTLACVEVGVNNPTH